MALISIEQVHIQFMSEHGWKNARTSSNNVSEVRLVIAEVASLFPGRPIRAIQDGEVLAAKGST